MKGLRPLYSDLTSKPNTSGIITIATSGVPVNGATYVCTPPYDSTVPAGVPSDSDPEKQQGPDMIFTDVGELVAGYGNERTSGDK